MRRIRVAVRRELQCGHAEHVYRTGLMAGAAIHLRGNRVPDAVANEHALPDARLRGEHGVSLVRVPHVGRIPPAGARLLHEARFRASAEPELLPDPRPHGKLPDVRIRGVDELALRNVEPPGLLRAIGPERVL